MKIHASIAGIVGVVVLALVPLTLSARGAPVAPETDGGRALVFDRLVLETTQASTATAALKPLFEEGFRVTPDSRTNALLVAAPDAESLARLRGIVAALDGVRPEVPAPRGAEGGRESVSVQVSIVGVGRNVLDQRGIELLAPGRTGLSDAAAKAVAELADAGVESGVTVHANLATALPLGKAKRWSRGTRYPTTAVSTAPGAGSTAGFGGYVSAAHEISLLARPGEAGATWIEVSYEVEQPLASDGNAPPTKVSMSGTYEVALRAGEVGVAGGRLGSDLDDGCVFLVVRLAAEK